MMLILIYIMGFITLLIGIFETKTLALLDIPDLYLQVVEAGNVYVTWIGRAGTALFLLGSALTIGLGFYKRKGRLPRQGMLMTAAWLGLYFPPLLSGLLTETGKLNYKILFFPLFLVAAYLGPRPYFKEAGRKFQTLLLIFIYTSLLGMFLRPEWAYAPYSESVIGIPIRLFGVASHPNGLGTIALASLLMSRVNKGKSRWEFVHRLAVITVMVLAQSKTIWLAWLLFFMVEKLSRVSFLKKEHLLKFVAMGIVLILLLSTCVLLLGQPSFQAGFVPTLIGRTSVWKLTLQVWLENPFLGYGPNIWDFEFRQRYGYLWAGQAHNQVLQAVGEAGILGLTCLLVFYLVLVREGIKCARTTNFATFGFVVMTLIRSFTEAPLRNYTIDPLFLINAMFFVIMIGADCEKQQAQVTIQALATGHT